MCNKICSYVNSAFDNVLQDDLFQVLTEVAHEDGILPSDLSVKDIMDSWTLKKGYKFQIFLSKNI